MRRIILTTLLGFLLAAHATQTLAEDQDANAPRAADRAAIERLVQQLGADDFRAREDASRKLAAFGPQARAALQKAVDESVSPEVRWRAEQLLRRLAGASERPLGAEAPRVEPQPAPPNAPAAGGIEELMARMRKQMEDLFKRDPNAGGLLSPLMRASRIEAPGLVLERALTGNVTLRVKRTRDGREIEDLFRGVDLADILARNPELAEHPGMGELKRREAETSWPGFEDFERLFGERPRIRIEGLPRGSGFSFSSTQGVEIQQDADGVTVRLRETDENGKETVRELKGKSLEDIKAKHPELADKLGRVGFTFRVSPPDFFWPGRQPRRLDPLRPTTPEPGALDGTVRFGLALDDVSDLLASHLRLDAGRGALVINVLPGTQAEAMGFRRNDVIVRIGELPVGKNAAAEALRKAAAERAPLEVEVIRAGESTRLSR